MQHSNMKKHEREAFLEEFEKERQGTLVAFCVMGGIFGEGIDLKRPADRCHHRGNRTSAGQR